MELLIVLVVIILIVALVLPMTGHPLPGGGLIGVLLAILVAVAVIYLLFGVVD